MHFLYKLLYILQCADLQNQPDTPNKTFWTSINQLQAHLTTPILPDTHSSGVSSFSSSNSVPVCLLNGTCSKWMALDNVPIPISGNNQIFPKQTNLSPLAATTILYGALSLVHFPTSTPAAGEKFGRDLSIHTPRGLMLPSWEKRQLIASTRCCVQVAGSDSGRSGEGQGHS